MGQHVSHPNNITAWARPSNMGHATGHFFGERERGGGGGGGGVSSLTFEMAPVGGGVLASDGTAVWPATLEMASSYATTPFPLRNLLNLRMSERTRQKKNMVGKKKTKKKSFKNFHENEDDEA
jgi:hypothetical protein